MTLHAVFIMAVHCHQQCTRIPFSPHPHQHMLSFVFLTVALLTSLRLYPIVVLICISLIISDAKHFFMYLLAICMPSWEKNVKSSVHFFHWIVILLLSCMSSLRVLDINPLSDRWLANIFSHSVGCLFILFVIAFDEQKLSSLIQPLFIFTFIACAFSVIAKKIIAKVDVKELFPVFSSRSFTKTCLRLNPSWVDFCL